MEQRTSLVVTSIAAPNKALREIARGALDRSLRFYVIGDSKSPADFHLEGCSFYSVSQQLDSGFRFAQLCPTRHYARKNIGYLLAMQDGAETIVETDDDNYPQADFWQPRPRRRHAKRISRPGWVNVYRCFTPEHIWPRGLPLDAVQENPGPYQELGEGEFDCPIQQGLADDNPDVDAIYRLVLPLPIAFLPGRSVVLEKDVWCPFNSQNTTWWADAFPLLYLPAYCSFRMTDIWRSFVAQRIAWENGWSLLFESATVKQDRNDHSLMRDFSDEIPGYLNNRAMGESLAALPLKPGRENLAGNLRLSYQELVRREWVGSGELPLLEAWLSDLQTLGLS